MSLNQLNKPRHQSYTSHVIDHLPWQRHTLTETVSLFRKKKQLWKSTWHRPSSQIPKDPSQIEQEDPWGLRPVTHRTHCNHALMGHSGTREA